MLQPAPANDDARMGRRWIGVDLARGLALLAMAAFHFGWDLSLFGFIDTDISSSPGWRAFARTIAGSFLILVGISLMLAHGGGIRWRPFWRRWLMVAAAAAAVTVATLVVFPDSFIYFGILHAIALSSLLALPFARANPAWAMAGAILCLVAPSFLRSPALNAPALLWLGLATAVPPTNDYEPILPWFGFVLTGIAAARLVLPRAPALPAAVATSAPARLLALGGRHSLAVYLIHQPILFGLVWLAAQATGPRPASDAAFLPDCEANCRETGQGADLCARTCACAAEELKRAGLFERTVRNRLSGAEKGEVSRVVQRCLGTP